MVLDTETTGLRAGRHGLTELYAARIDGHGNIKDEFHSLINPGHHIPRFITGITGITDEMVEHAPNANVVMKAFSKFLNNDDIIVGHNVSFDLSFLDHACVKSCGEALSHRTLCTLRLGRRVMAANPIPSYKLGLLAEHYGISSIGAHRAKNDVIMTIELLKHFFQEVENKTEAALEDVLAIQRWPLSKAARVFC